jgi:hypothetical protein
LGVRLGQRLGGKLLFALFLFCGYAHANKFWDNSGKSAMRKFACSGRLCRFIQIYKSLCLLNLVKELYDFLLSAQILHIRIEC